MSCFAALNQFCTRTSSLQGTRRCMLGGRSTFLPVATFLRNKGYSVNLPQNIKFQWDFSITTENRLVKELPFGELYHWQQKNNTSGEDFILHDGPPYANGSPHMGHAFNKVVKDFAARYQMLRGKRVHFRPGWDCHGMPIEVQVAQKIEKSGRSLQDVSPLEIRKLARQHALDFVDKQRDIMKRWTIMADWENPYLTLSNDYVANQLSVFSAFHEKGLVYRALKPVYWSMSSRTALAEAELEYTDLKSPSIYVKFPIASSPSVPAELQDVSLLIWTTTPWTLPANEAVCYNTQLEYCIVRVTSGAHQGDQYAVVSDQLDALRKCLDIEVVCQLAADKLAGLQCHHPIDSGRTVPVLVGDHVTSSSGTGLVHTAPSHGHDDYLVGRKHQLPLPSLVADNGCYVEECGSRLAGKFVLTKGNAEILCMLDERRILVSHQEFSHRYPIDWRTKKPVIVRPMKQWFIKTKDLVQEALTCLESVKFIPDTSDAALKSMLKLRSDWCISRQRSWCVPIPVFYGAESGRHAVNKEIIEHVKSLVLEHGSDIWWSADIDQLLPKDLRDKYFDGEEVVRGYDTMDVWFDSGCSWSNVVPRDESGQHAVADLYLEGQDQARGWFQSSLLTSTALRRQAPYKTLFMHGFVLDKSGQKMSKSKGNIIDPVDVVHGMKKGNEPVAAIGSDALRMWATLSTGQSPLIGQDEINTASERLRFIRRSARFMLQHLQGFDVNTQLVAHDRLLPLDAYMLYMLHDFISTFTGHMDDMSYSYASFSLHNLVRTDLQGYYFHVLKGRLVSSPKLSPERSSGLTVLYHYLSALHRLIAPFVPVTAEEIVRSYPEMTGVEKPTSAFHHGWPLVDPQWAEKTAAIETMQLALSVLDLVHQAASHWATHAGDKRCDLFIKVDNKRLHDRLQLLNGSEGRMALTQLAEILKCNRAFVEHVSDVDGARKSPAGMVSSPVQLLHVGDDAEASGNVAVCFAAPSGQYCDRCRVFVSTEKDQLCTVCQQAESEAATHQR
eukprot:scpid7207/ scgid18253/ Isoleucine--tRNA ligase, mitochondrial; Isoleucyl-tRNA synthetase